MKSLTFLLCFFSSFSLFSQLDTMIVYDVATQTVEIVPPVDFDSTVTFERTGSDPGNLPGVATLSEVPPSTNLFEDAEFSQLAPAADFFDIKDYPLRTAVRINIMNADTVDFICSGILVGNNMVLTGSICLYNSQDGWSFESLEVLPAFDDGTPQLGLSSSVDKCYIFKNSGGFLALLELSEPIGKELGWVGIGFTEDDFLDENVMHKFSYRYGENPFNIDEVFTGDTLSYNYGLMSFTPGGNGFGVPSSDAYHVFGQGGSSAIYTDNDTYFSLGITTYSTQYRHERIVPSKFYQLKNVIDNNVIAPVGPEPIFDGMVEISPNPFSEKATVQFPNPLGKEFDFQLFHINGQLAHAEKGKGESLEIFRNELPAGMYLFRMEGLGDVPVFGRLIAQ